MSEVAGRDAEPAWAQGVSLESLREAATLFKERHGRHVYGAFGLLKEAHIAPHIKAGEFLTRRVKGKLAAAAIVREARQVSTQHDYTGRAIKILPGQTYISALAVRDKKAGRDMLGLRKGKMWVEIFEEDDTAQQIMDEACFAYAFTKIMADGSIKGVYCSGIEPPPMLEKAERVGLHLLNPAFVSPIQMSRLCSELEKSEAVWAQHYSSYNKRKSWTSFALRGYDSADPSFIIKPAEMSRGWKEENPARLEAKCEDTPLMALFPTVRSILAKLPGPAQRVRFMKLNSGDGELSRHADITDREAGVAPGKIARLHIPVLTNSEVEFCSWTDRGIKTVGHFLERSLFYLDTRKPHTVTNRGQKPRTHLVIDVPSDKWLRDKLGSAA
jgi:hypothetical protein